MMSNYAICTCNKHIKLENINDNNTLDFCMHTRSYNDVQILNYG